jgi:hypothetical protein
MKRLVRSLGSVIAIVTLVSAAASAKDFEGKIVYRKTVGTVVTPTVHYLKPGLLRVESTAAAPAAESRSLLKAKHKVRPTEDPEATASGTGTIIMRLAEKRVIILMPEQKQYMVQNLDLEKAAKDLKVGETTIERTGQTERIAGYECAQYLIKNRYGSTEIWAAEGINGYIGTGGAGGRGGATAASAWETVVREKGLFPLRTITYNVKGKETMRLEAISVEAQRLSDDLFQPPADYTEFTMPGMPNLGDLMNGR